MFVCAMDPRLRGGDVLVTAVNRSCRELIVPANSNYSKLVWVDDGLPENHLARFIVAVIARLSE